jgi:hypothetical protein
VLAIANPPGEVWPYRFTQTRRPVVTAGGAADLYVTMFHKVYAAIRDTAPLPGVSAP